MQNHILIKNVRIFNAKTGSFSDPCDIRIENGIVMEISKDISIKSGYDVLQEYGLFASTGWTDCHTHFGGHFGGFDPFLTYPGLGVTSIHEAGSNGVLDYPKFHELVSRLPFSVSAYLYVGVYGISKEELKTLDNIQETPFLEMVQQYPEEIVGAKIRIDPRVNCDTRKSLVMAKELAVKAGIPLAVHPSRCKDSIEEILAVLDKDDVYAHTYSPVCPNLFDEHGKLKKAVWNAVERGVRFDLSHGSNNFSYDIARQSVEQGFLTDTISTDLHKGNYKNPGITLAGVMTKAIQSGFGLEDALKKVIVEPSRLLHVIEKAPDIQVGQKADITLFTISDEGTKLPDVTGKTEVCRTVIKDVATVIGASLNRSYPVVELNESY